MVIFLGIFLTSIGLGVATNEPLAITLNIVETSREGMLIELALSTNLWETMGVPN